VVQELDLQNDENCFKAFQVGSQHHKRYSQKAIERIKEALPSLKLEEIWARRKPPGRKGRGQKAGA
jgi:hypothetical protein